MRGDMPEKVKIWDIAVRLFHWSLAVAFVLAAFSAFQDKFGLYGDMHTYAGTAVLALVLWRVVWGFLGSESARFTSFVRGPKAIKGYLEHGDAAKCPGHNPLGAVSVVVMLLLLLAQAVMGLFASDDMFFGGPFAELAGDKSGLITELHEINGFILMGLAGLHILVVLYYSLIKKAGLLAAMITGYKPQAKKRPMLVSPILALGIFALIGAAVWAVVLA